jgi:hypothetical protein
MNEIVFNHPLASTHRCVLLSKYIAIYIFTSQVIMMKQLQHFG